MERDISAFDLASTRSNPIWDAYTARGIDVDELIRSMDARGRLEPVSYVDYRRKPFKSAHFNLGSDRFHTRATVKSPRPGARKVFVFGGSTTVGHGVIDADTMPSYLQRELGDGYDVVNYGEVGFQSTQSVHLLVELLAAGEVPDFVIFYDGVNDHFVALAHGGPRMTMFARQLVARYSLSPTILLLGQTGYGRLVTHVQSRRALREALRDAGSRMPDLTNAVIHSYEANVRVVQALAAAYGFKAAFFWQPDLFSSQGRRKPFPTEKELERSFALGGIPIVELWQQASQQYEQRLTNRDAEGIHYLGHALDDLNEAVYIDQCHLGARGNQQVAKAIHTAILDELKRSDSIEPR